jgi:hypothetical protein
MFTRAFATSVNSLAGVLTPADAASIVARLSVIGEPSSGVVTLGSAAGAFKLTSFTGAPPYDATRINAPPIITIIGNLGNVANNSGLAVTVYDARGASLGSKNLISTANAVRSYGFPLAYQGSVVNDPKLTLYIRAINWVGPITLDAVYMDFYSASGMVSLPGTFGYGWDHDAYEASWESSMWAQTGTNGSPRTFFTFPAAGIDSRATLVGSSFTIDQNFWSNIHQSGITQSPAAYICQYPLTSPAPFDTTPSMRVVPTTFRIPQGYTSDSVNSTTAGDNVTMTPNPIVYGYEGCLWTEGSAIAGGYIPTLANFNAAQVAMGYSVDHRWTVGTPGPTSARTEVKLPTLTVYYDAAPPVVGGTHGCFFMEC